MASAASTRAAQHFWRNSGQFFIASAAASLRKGNAKVGDRFLVNRCGRQLRRARDAPGALKTFLRQLSKTFSTASTQTYTTARPLRRPLSGSGTLRMNLLSRGIDPGHRIRQLCIDMVFDRHHTEIRIFTVKTPFNRLIGMLELVITNHGRLLQSHCDVTFETPGAFDLAGHTRTGTAGIRQARIATAKRKFKNQARLPRCCTSVDGCTRVQLVAIERDHIEVAAGRGDHA